MRILPIALSFFLFLPLSAQKKDVERMKAYFSSALSSENTFGKVPSRKMGVTRISAYRQAAWQAWREANADYDEAKLIPLDSLSEGKSGSWALPATLEPDAVMPYYFGAKGVKPEAGYPFFLYLHGSGPKVSEWTTSLQLGNRFADSPSMYFIPQIPNEGAWYRWWQKSKQWAWEKLFRQILLRSDVDANRLYCFGISEGGYGSQRLASFYADYLAAAGPMAGGEPLKNAPVENVGKIGFSLRTGALDKGFYRDRLTLYVKEALDSMEHLNPADFRHTVQLIPDCGHSIDYSPTTPWLLHYRRVPRPMNFIWEDFEMDGRHRRGFYNLAVLHRPDSMLRTRYAVDIANNEVNIAIDNVKYTTTETDPKWGIELQFARSYQPASGGRIVVYLDEKSVDLLQPVTVKVNGETYYTGTPRPDLQNMLKSIELFGDPERVYPVGIEIAY